MAPSLANLLPILYGACFLVLLWQAFRVMARGFQAVPRPGDPGSCQAGGSAGSVPVPDRTGRLTIHPELLDDDGELTREDLLTVRFGGENDQPVRPSDAG
jgi:Protein of unknown function (DUF2973)